MGTPRPTVKTLGLNPNHDGVDFIMMGSNIYDTPPGTLWVEADGTLTGSSSLPNGRAYIAANVPGYPTKASVAEWVARFTCETGSAPSFVYVILVYMDGPGKSSDRYLGYNLLLSPPPESIPA
jgi:hypothetical protein